MALQVLRCLTSALASRKSLQSLDAAVIVEIGPPAMRDYTPKSECCGRANTLGKS